MDQLARKNEELPGAIVAALKQADPDKIDAYLEHQAELARLQAEELVDERRLKHWRARIEHWSGILKLSFEVAVALVVLLVLIAIGAAIWDAAHDKALVIETFSVPPELADRGLDGKAVAAQIQDRLASMQEATQSVRPADSYANNWGDDIKVQIPETGVSIGEVRRLLVNWLGHETHITGEIWRTKDGYSATTRTGSDGSATVTAKDADLDGLLQRAAESIYRRTQPYRYAVYLQHQSPPDWERIRAIHQSQLSDSSPRERAWAYVGLSNVDSNTGNDARALEELRQAVAILPTFSLAYQNLESQEASMGHEEAALHYAEMNLRVLPQDREVAPDSRMAQLPLSRAETKVLRGDYRDAVPDYEEAFNLPGAYHQNESLRLREMMTKSFLHDVAGVQAIYDSLPPPDPSAQINRSATYLFTRYALGRWSELPVSAQAWEAELTKKITEAGATEAAAESVLSRQVRPYFAVAAAMRGDFAQAHALVDRTPVDCDPCLRARGRIAAAEHRWAASQYWFERAVRHAPSIGQGYSDWGAMLLAKGDFDDAIAKLAVAHAKAPRFADPLELWGEALIRKNRSDLAVIKFAEAAQLAPNWARLHLKWGEALHWLGRDSDARTQWGISKRLILTEGEKQTLARLERGAN